MEPDKTKKLLLVASEIAKKLSQVEAGSDLVSGDSLVLRLRLRDLCERIILQPKASDYVLTAEDLLWRKVFYNNISALRKKKDNCSDLLSLQLNSALCYYCHLLNKIQMTYGGDCVGDFEDESWRNEKSSKSSDYGSMRRFRCLLCLGDICRYMSELDESCRDTSSRFYHQALASAPHNGSPLNQLGTLCGTAAHGLHAVYYYLHAISRQTIFPGAAGNLKRALDKAVRIHAKLRAPKHHIGRHARADAIKTMLLQFQYIVHMFLYERAFKNYEVIQEWLKNLDSCLSFERDPMGDDSRTSVAGDKCSYLSGDAVFEIVCCIIMVIHQLQSKRKASVTTAQALMIACVSLVVKHCGSRSEAVAQCLAESEENARKSLRYRKRRVSGELGDDSDLSETDDENSRLADDSLSAPDSDVQTDGDKRPAVINEADESLLDSDSDSRSGFAVPPLSGAHLRSELPKLLVPPGFAGSAHEHSAVELERKLANFSIETDTETAISSVECDWSKRSRSERVLKQIVQLGQIELLMAAKLATDWFTVNADIASTCQDYPDFWYRMITLLNHLPSKIDVLLLGESVEPSVAKIVAVAECENFNQNWPVACDVVVRGLLPLQSYYAMLKWGRAPSLNKVDETVLLIGCLRQFGDFASRLPEQPIAMETASGMYVVKTSAQCERVAEDSTAGASSASTTMMARMATLRLQAEVSNLEQLDASAALHTPITPYLIVDTSVFLTCMQHLRRIAATADAAIIIPRSTLRQLDTMKKTSLEARDASRWIEKTLTAADNGTSGKIVRAQAENEHLCVEGEWSSNEKLSGVVKVVECAAYLQAKGIGSSEASGAVRAGGTTALTTILFDSQLFAQAAATSSFADYCRAQFIHFADVATLLPSDHRR